MSVAHKLTAVERRAVIVEAAIKLFSEKGFRGATTRELAAASGVSEPVIYQHFATKGDLYAAIIDRKSNGIGNIVAELESFMKSDDDEGFFRHLASLILRFHESDPAYLRLLLYSGLERHELSELFHQRQACGFEQAVTGYISRRIDHGAFRNLNPALIAQSFMGMVANYGMGCMLKPDKKPRMTRDEVIDGMVGIFLKGITNEAR